MYDLLVSSAHTTISSLKLNIACTMKDRVADKIILYFFVKTYKLYIETNQTQKRIFTDHTNFWTRESNSRP